MNGDFADVILAIGNTNYVAVNEEVGEKSLRQAGTICGTFV